MPCFPALSFQKYRKEHSYDLMMLRPPLDADVMMCQISFLGFSRPTLFGIHKIAYLFHMKQGPQLLITRTGKVVVTYRLFILPLLNKRMQHFLNMVRINSNAIADATFLPRYPVMHASTCFLLYATQFNYCRCYDDI